MQTNTIQPLVAAQWRLAALIVCLGYTLTSLAPAMAAQTTTMAEAQQPGNRIVTIRLQDAAPIVKEDTRPGEPAVKRSDDYSLQTLQVVSDRLTTDRPQRLRSIEYSSNQLVVTGVTADGVEKSRVVLADPRLVRAESFGADGLGESHIVFHQSVDFSVVLTDEPSIVEVRVMKPRWAGDKWAFDVIAKGGL